MAFKLRHAEPDDYAPIIEVVNEWWGGRQMADMLPKLFLVHFRETSFVAEQDGLIRGFVIGFQSQTHPEQAYVHFVGVDPVSRGSGLGRALYEGFFDAAVARKCTQVHAVTSPGNSGSISFHRSMGFECIDGVTEAGDPVPHPDYDGPGEARVRFRRVLN